MDDETTREKKVPEKLIAQLFGSLLDSNFSGVGQEVTMQLCQSESRHLYFTSKGQRFTYIMANFQRCICSKFNQERK
jgi:hypothetical protein